MIEELDKKQIHNTNIEIDCSKVMRGITIEIDSNSMRGTNSMGGTNSRAIIKLTRFEKDAIAMNNIRSILAVNILLLISFISSTYWWIWYIKTGSVVGYKCWINLYFFDSEYNHNLSSNQLLILSIQNNCSIVDNEINNCNMKCDDLIEIAIVQTISGALFVSAILFNIIFIYQLTLIIKKIKAGILINKGCGPNNNQIIIFALYLLSFIVSGLYLWIIKRLKPDWITIAGYFGILILYLVVMLWFLFVYKYTLERNMVDRLLEAAEEEYMHKSLNSNNALK